MEIQNSCILRLRLEDTGRELTFYKPQILIGKTTDCDVSFPDKNTLSRAHAMIVYQDGIWHLSDCSSRNGTWLNGRRLEPGKTAALNPGDCIDLAHVQKILFLEGYSLSAPVPFRDDFSSFRSTQSWTATPSGTHDPTPPMPAPPRPAPPMPAPPRPAPPMPAPPRPAPPTPAPPRPAPPMPAPPRPAPPMPAPPAPAPSMAPSSAPAQKKQGLLARLFGGKGHAAAPAAPVRPDPVPVTPDDVQFRGTAPESITPGEYFPVKIMMYREDDYQRADRESAALADRTKSASSSVFQASQGQEFRIALQSPDIALDCESQQLRWNGKFAAADFEVFLPEDYTGRQLRLRGRVYSGDAVLTDLKLILQIRSVQPQSVVCEKVRLRSAFISYASADRARVVARIQGIQLACPDMDLFFDVESLRRGENWEPRLYQEIAGRDLFYLFWSHNAASSEWVKKELIYAVSNKTLDYIEPIPLESPEVCAPPESLMGKHFNDWTLRYLNNQ